MFFYMSFYYGPYFHSCLRLSFISCLHSLGAYIQNVSALSIWHAAKSATKASESGDVGSWLGGNQIFLGVALLWVSRLSEKGSPHHKVSLGSPQPILPHAFRCIVPFRHLLNICPRKLFNTVYICIRYCTYNLYLSRREYVFARNISSTFQSLEYVKNYLELFWNCILHQYLVRQATE